MLNFGNYTVYIASSFLVANLTHLLSNRDGIVSFTSMNGWMNDGWMVKRVLNSQIVNPIIKIIDITFEHPLQWNMDPRGSLLKEEWAVRELSGEQKAEDSTICLIANEASLDSQSDSQGLRKKYSINCASATAYIFFTLSSSSPSKKNFQPLISIFAYSRHRTLPE